MNAMIHCIYEAGAEKK